MSNSRIPLTLTLGNGYEVYVFANADYWGEEASSWDCPGQGEGVEIHSIESDTGNEDLGIEHGQIIHEAYLEQSFEEIERDFMTGSNLRDDYEPDFDYEPVYQDPF